MIDLLLFQDIGDKSVLEPVAAFPFVHPTFCSCARSKTSYGFETPYFVHLLSVAFIVEVGPVGQVDAIVGRAHFLPRKLLIAPHLDPQPVLADNRENIAGMA